MGKEYLIKEVGTNDFEIWYKVSKKKLTWKGWKHWEEFEPKPFYNWVWWKGKLWNNSFGSVEEAEDFLRAEKEHKEKELVEKHIII